MLFIPPHKLSFSGALGEDLTTLPSATGLRQACRSLERKPCLENARKKSGRVGGAVVVNVFVLVFRRADDDHGSIVVAKQSIRSPRKSDTTS